MFSSSSLLPPTHSHPSSAVKGSCPYTDYVSCCSLSQFSVSCSVQAQVIASALQPRPFKPLQVHTVGGPLCFSRDRFAHLYAQVSVLAFWRSRYNWLKAPPSPKPSLRYLQSHRETDLGASSGPWSQTQPLAWFPGWFPLGSHSCQTFYECTHLFY